MTAATGDSAARTRRRGDVLTAAIYRAVREELDRNGYAAVTMDSVARRAGTGKAALYRRWPSPAELIVDTIQASLPDADALPDTGSLRGDILALVTGVATRLEGTAGVALRGLRAQAILDPGLSRRISTHTRDTSSHKLRQLLQRAVARGELRPEPVADLALQAGPAILRDHFLFRDLRALDLEQLVDRVILPLLAPQRPAPPDTVR